MGNIWLPDAPPASAGSEDDEFDGNGGAGVPTGWTEVDHSTVQTVSENEAGLVLYQATNASNSNTGIYKAIPAGDFTAWTKVGVSGITSLSVAHQAGFALWEDATNSAGDVYLFMLHIYQNDGNSALLQRWTSHAAFGSSVVRRFIQGDQPNGIYLRIRRSTTTYAFDIGSDGIGWHRIHSGALAFVPTHFGPVMANFATGADVRAHFKFFRYVASDVGVDGRVGGDRITVAAAGGAGGGNAPRSYYAHMVGGMR